MASQIAKIVFVLLSISVDTCSINLKQLQITDMKIKNTLFIILTLLLFNCQSIFSQGWVESYPGISPNFFDSYSIPEILKTPDGGQLLFGSFATDYGPQIYNVYMFKTDQQGKYQWSNWMSNSSILAAGEEIGYYDMISVNNGYLAVICKFGSYIDIVGSSIELAMYTPNGQLDWNKTIEPLEDDTFFSIRYKPRIQALTDGNFLISAFYSEECDDDCLDTYLQLKVDNDGNTIWRKTHSMDLNYSPARYQDAVDKMGNLVLVVLNSNKELDIHLFDSNGDYQSTQNYFPNDTTTLLISDLKFSSENHLILGLTRTNGAFVYNIDLQENQIIWDYIYGTSVPFPALYDFCIFPDDQVALLYNDVNVPDSIVERGRYRKLTLISSDGTVNEENILAEYNSNFYSTEIYSTESLNFKFSASRVECCEDGSMLLSGRQYNINRYLDPIEYTELNALMKIGSNHQIFTSKVNGKLYIDENENCIYDEDELGIANQIVYLPNSSYYTITNSSGDYSFILNEGTYETTTSLTDYNLWKTACPDSTFAFTIGNNDTIVNNDLAYYSELYCPLMTVSFGASFLRRCFPNNFYVDYCNLGTVPIDTAFVEVDFGEYITVDSASLSYEITDDGTYIFDIPETLGISDCGRIIVYTTVDCEAPLEAISCSEANIYPNDFCGDVNDLWDRSDIEVSSECVGDTIEFRIFNSGQGMINPRGYIIYEDNLLREAGDFELGALMDTIIKVVSGPYTYRMTAEQSPFYPDDSNPQTFIEGCESVNMTGVQLTVPQDDQMLYRDIDCKPIIGSFDPNDKLVSPAGVGEEHFTKPEAVFEYTIRFQNVGNDTAFNIYILDTISQHLDMSTFVSGVSSHDYEVQIIEGNIIRWDFPNILLVDSVKNEPDSHGFVKFNIEQKPNNPDGTVIENTAGIYFDFNAPIITPPVFNTIKRPPFYDDFCEDFTVNMETFCSNDKEEFDVILSMTGGYPGANGYNIIDNITGATFFNIANVISIGPYSVGSGVDISVSVADHPECTEHLSVSMIDCITTDIALLNFSGTIFEQANELIWSVATERKIKHYELLRSTNGQDFKMIHKIAAKGNENTIANYYYEDKAFEKTSNYYQLRYTDFSGRTKLSKTLFLDNSNKMIGVELYPNPASDFLSVNFESSRTATNIIQIINKEGKEIYTEKFKVTAGLNQLPIDISSLNSGIYFIKMIEKTDTQIIKFIKE